MYTFKWVRWLEKLLQDTCRSWNLKRQGFRTHVSYQRTGTPLYFVTRISNGSILDPSQAAWAQRYPVNSYWCPYCYNPLWGGPEAGMSVNMVCTYCMPCINFGCLPGAYDDPVPPDRRRLSQEEVEAVLGKSLAFEQALLGLNQ